MARMLGNIKCAKIAFNSGLPLAFLKLFFPEIRWFGLLAIFWRFQNVEENKVWFRKF
jgi:hypothetical protein